MSDPLFDIFSEEAREHLGALERGFLDLEATEAVDARRNVIDHLFRHAHSLKGDAKVVGLTDMKLAAQQLEDLLDELRSAPETVTRERIDSGLAGLDRLRQEFDAWQQQGDSESAPLEEPSEPENLPEPEKPVARQIEPSGAADQLPQAIRDTPRRPTNQSTSRTEERDESFTVRVPSQRLDRMLNLAGEVRIFQRAADSVQQRLSELGEHLTTSLRALDSPTPATSRPAIESALDQVRRIGDDLHNKNVREELLLEGLETNIREARLLPLVMLTDVMRRAVRDLAQSLGKPLNYEADVDGILLDKSVIEALKDPLLHLVRNAADHGIESAEMRAAAGKPAEATLRIAATQRGPLVVITISDDGGGIDFAKIRAAVLRGGELDDDEVQGLSDESLVAYMFQPGFSTATAGDVSGRGVGLDVVMDTLRRLHGSVRLASTSKSGTSFSITVPVTISSVRVLTVSCGGQCYGVPSTSVLSTGRVKRSELLELQGGLVLRRDDESIQWASLAEWLGLPAAPQAASTAIQPYLLITHNDQTLAVYVDDLEDETEVLLKPLGFPLGSMPGIMGATIRGDGSVLLVLDLTNAHWTRGESTVTSTKRQSVTAKILVVDDSPITRAVLRKVFVAAGYHVSTATDGMDALEQLRVRRFDLVVTDVEMPRLNGFDLTRRIKSKWGLPVILVTAREQEEHRREGMAAGADAYVVKSTFEDRGLLEIVAQFVS